MVCTNPNCGKDCPYAESPSPRTFRCYECRMISDMMGKTVATTAPKVPKVGPPRALNAGDIVHRHDSSGRPLAFKVLEVYGDEFFVRRLDTSAEAWVGYNYCKPGQFTVWKHEDGSTIIPP